MEKLKICCRQPDAEYGVHVAADSPDEGSHKIFFSWELAPVTYHWPHFCQDALLFISRIQVGNITTFQNVVNILQE